MNILFLTLHDFSTIEEKGLYADLMREFEKNNHNIYIISPREKRKKQPTELIKNDRCEILKLQIGNTQKTNLIEKGISTLTLESRFVKGIKKYFHNIKFDLVIYSTPPITLQKAVEYVKRRDGAKTYLLLKDIFPQNAIDLGMLKKKGVKGLLYKYFRIKEKKLYRISDYIGCMSKANVDYILKNNREIPSESVEICPNTIEPENILNDSLKVSGIRRKYNIPQNKTVFVYGGNIGEAQGVKFLMECLRENINNEQIFFIIVGSGTKFQELKAFISTENIPNVQLIKHLPKDEYELLVHSCDVGLIFLDKRFTIPNIPSRLLSYMQASMPVLAATDRNTDLKNIIQNGNIGYWCESGDIKEFNRYITALCKREKRIQMGENARRYLEDNYTAEHSYKIIMKHF